MSDLFARTYTIGTATSTQVVAPHTAPQHVSVHDHTKQGGRSLFVGGPDVSATNGFHILATDNFSMILPAGESLHAITTGDTIEAQILVAKM